MAATLPVKGAVRLYDNDDRVPCPITASQLYHAGTLRYTDAYLRIPQTVNKQVQKPRDFLVIGVVMARKTHQDLFHPI